MFLSGMGTTLPPVTTQYIAPGWRGTYRTIHYMGKLAGQGGRDPVVRHIAEKALGNSVRSRDYTGECQRLWQFLRQHVRYTLDPRGLEWLQKPRHLLTKSRIGDCDDSACCYAALALALGHEAGFRAIKVDPNRPDEFSHVYPIVRPNGTKRWLAADTTEPQVSFGQPPEKGRKIFGSQMWAVDAERDIAVPIKIARA